MPRRLMPALSPASRTWAASVCRSTWSDIPMCRCWIGDLVRHDLLRQRDDADAEEQDGAPSVAPMIGVYSA